MRDHHLAPETPNSSVPVGALQEDPFSDPTINAQIVAEVSRVRAAWLEWNAEGGEGSFDDRIMKTLVDTLDGHAKVLLRAVDGDSRVPAYGMHLRRVGTALIKNAEQNSLLKPMWPVPAGAWTDGSDLAQAEAAATVRERAERWGQWRNQMLSRIEMRFEARYLHWQAEALERVRQQQTATGDQDAEAKHVTAWEEIKIEFLSDERAQVWAGGESSTCNYAELGFVDRRNGKPNQPWIVLRRMAETGGTLKNPAAAGKRWPAAEKHVQRIRKILRERFRLEEDPLPFVEAIGYRARFKIGCARSFNS